MSFDCVFGEGVIMSESEIHQEVQLFYNRGAIYSDLVKENRNKFYWRMCGTSDCNFLLFIHVDNDKHLERGATEVEFTKSVLKWCNAILEQLIYA